MTGRHDPADPVCREHVPGAIYDRALHICPICQGPDKPTNRRLVLTGADDGSTGYDVDLEWTDGSMHRLFRIEPGGDAIAIGMIFAGYQFPEPALLRRTTT